MSTPLRAGAVVLAGTALVATTSLLPASAATPGKLSITNGRAPSNSLIVMNKIQNHADANQRTLDKVTVTLKNTGKSPLRVTSATTGTSDFSITSPWKLPFSLGTGKSVNLTVNFTADGGAWHNDAAKIVWNNGTSHTNTIKLTGWWQKYSEHNQEPTFQALVSHFGYKTKTPKSMYSRGEYKKFSADEVLSPYWRMADGKKSVKVTQLAAWHTYPDTSTISVYSKGKPGKLRLLQTSNRFDAQSAMPRNQKWGKGSFSFKRAGVFGWKLKTEFSDPKLQKTIGADKAVGCDTKQCGQHVRVFQVRGANGKVVKNAYLFTEDLAGVNYDFNDAVFLVQGIKPA
ncbi:hypothetical protein FHX74_000235 [Friedmanniella endophytica]|uniref:HYDIN/VesB/CFA65-like Ig-like domain-containing protein n=1 Tax=Microlunatus kandeliicorticis TaxID=1759536 RepID=A0A7W3IP45_9ACTN|nr:hypothetical protein [Microlunatus kandeliicorticis]MBA8792641.1 hypothetical protein [Microlunatus kandeliicorticis]